VNLKLLPALVSILLLILGIVLLLPTEEAPQKLAKKPDLLIKGSLLANYDWDEPASESWVLPKNLKEISGASFYQGNRILIHNDEKAIVYEFLPDGSVETLVKNGSPAQKGDFEGIATSGELIYLLASNGLMQVFDMEAGTISEVDTGLGDVCELEGLDYDQQTDMLVFACKQLHENQEVIRLYRARKDLTELALWIEIPFSDLPSGLKSFYPSAVTLGENILLASARREALLEISRTGKPTSVVRFSKKVHPQTEGLLLSPAGDLLVMDEGKKKGTLRRYEPASQD